MKEVAHRPWPLPTGPWVMAQSWHDLLFAHWPVDAAVLREKIPAPLEIDTFRGQTWLAVVPFRMSGVRLRWTPGLPRLSNFPELNVRTYVAAGGKPGVWFFSLDAGNSLAVAIARRWFHLPYFRARMSCEERDGWIRYSSVRRDGDGLEALLEGKYRPIGGTIAAETGSLEHFLTERYCLYAADGKAVSCAEKSIIPRGRCDWPRQYSREIRCPRRRGFRCRRKSRSCTLRAGRMSWSGHQGVWGHAEDIGSPNSGERLPVVEDEEHRQSDAGESRRIVPLQFFAKIKNRKSGEDPQGNERKITCERSCS